MFILFDHSEEERGEGERGERAQKDFKQVKKTIIKNARRRLHAVQNNI